MSFTFYIAYIFVNIHMCIQPYELFFWDDFDSICALELFINDVCIYFNIFATLQEIIYIIHSLT